MSLTQWQRDSECNDAFNSLVNLPSFSSLVRRIDLRLVPASMVIYLLCFLDRSNIVSIRLSFPVPHIH